jgi:glutaminase
MPDPAISRQVDERLRELYERHLSVEQADVVTFYDPARGSYPPELAGEERDRFGIALAAADGELYAVGDDATPFALQSISKVFAYSLALADHGRDHVMRHVGVEPSGDAFHSIVFDERNNRPYNPMVNAGALVTTDLVRGSDPGEKLERLLDIVRRYAGNPNLDVDEETFDGEIQNADRNRAAAYLMRSQGMLGGDVEAILSLYLRQCSITATCRDVAVMGATLANGGVNPLTGERVLARARVRDVLSVMYTCGMYDFAGEWAFEVGVPAKSGVSGAILAAVPDKMGIAVLSPGLDAYGNSVRGTRVCREISGRLGLHTFATDSEDAMLRTAEREPPSRPAAR